MENKLFKYLPKKNQWVLILLVGILLVVIAMPTTSNILPQADMGLESEETDASNMEKKLENMLEKIKGVGEVHVMITFKEEQQVEGILVIADGGGNPVIIRNITEVVQALFDVDSHKIKVIERNQMN